MGRTVNAIVCGLVFFAVVCAVYYSWKHPMGPSVTAAWKAYRDRLEYEEDGQAVLLERYPSGAVSSRTEYSIDERGYPYREGMETNWTTSGKVKRSLGWRHNEMHGEYREFFCDGTVKVSGQHQNGNRTGTWKWYNQSGGLVAEEEY
ncbi:MAG: hypothetical protein WD066_10740 [Planctomycetaceae bacterium]